MLKKELTEAESKEQDRIDKLEVGKQTREYCREIFSTIREPLLVLDVDLKILLANRAFYTTFKVEPKETIGQFIYDLGNKQWNIPKLRNLLEDILPHNNSFEDFVVEHKFQTIGQKTMLLNARRIPRPPEKPKIILLAIEDITKRTKKELHLLETSELRYRRLFESARDGIILMDYRTGMIMDVNQFLIDMLGYSKNDFLNKHLWDIGVFKDIAESKQNFLELQKKKYIHYENLPLETKDGKEIATEIMANVYRVDGETIIQCNIRDVTEHVEMESNLRENEKRFRAIFEQSGMPKVLTAPNGRFLKVNDAFAEMVGYTEKELITGDFLKITHPDDKTLSTNAVKKILSGKVQTDRFEKRYIHKSGRIIWVDLNITLLRNENGKPQFFIVGSTDITHRKLMEETVKKSEKYLKTMFDSALDGIVIVEVKTKKIISANHAIAKKLGYNQKELLKFHLADLHPKKDYEKILSQFNKMTNRKSTLAVNIPVKKKNGSVYYADISSAVFNFNDKKVQMGFFRDITERKELEEKTAKAYSLMESSLDSIVDGILVIDTNQKVSFFNNRFLELWNVPKTLADKGDDKLLLNFVSDQLKDPKEFIAQVEHLYKHKQEISSDTIFFKDGRILDRYSRPQRMGGAIVGRVWSFRDITKEKELEESKNDFLSIAAHDLRTPMSEIKANLGMILEGGYGEIPPKFKPALDDINKSNLNLIHMVNDFLTIGQFERRKIIIKKHSLDIIPILKSSIEHIKIGAKKKGLEFSAKIPENIPRVMTDPNKITEVIDNIFDNALKFTDKGSIKCAVSVKDKNVLVMVKDTGIGISKEGQKGIFQKYSQVGTEKRIAVGEGTGLGLGLYISKLIIEGCGGKIWLESEAGKGCTVFFSLPVATK